MKIKAIWGLYAIWVILVWSLVFALPFPTDLVVLSCLAVAYFVITFKFADFWYDNFLTIRLTQDNHCSLAYTDYPIKAYGDKAGQIARMRQCYVIGYDGDKYCKVFIPADKQGIPATNSEVGDIFNLKACYVYSNNTLDKNGNYKPFDMTPYEMKQSVWLSLDAWEA